MADVDCVKCLESKPESEFYVRNVRGKPYRRKTCKSCEKSSATDWRKSNQEKVRAADRERYWQDSERFKAKVRDRRKNFPDRAYESDKAQRERRRALIHGSSYVRVPREALHAKLAYHGGLCAYCGVSPDEIHWDHWKPISKGGPHMLSNLFPSCPQCNQRKAASWPFGKPYTDEVKVNG